MHREDPPGVHYAALFAAAAYASVPCHHATIPRPSTPCSVPHTTSGVMLSLYIARETTYRVDAVDIRLECWTKAIWNEARCLVQDCRCYTVVDAEADGQSAFSGEKFYG